MCSVNSADSGNIPRITPLVCLLVLAWFVYLSTLSPTVFYRDTPEFTNTAFSLGISHPAGFPIYNLMAKTVTFLPMGSVQFKVNLFSSLVGCLALLVLYMASVTFLRVLAGPEHSDGHSWAALLPVGFIAFCIPFWGNTLLAEVYTLHTLFTVLIIWGLLKWKEKEDIRYLYSAALIYGLSAGNHGTVAFYLPAILILFLFWCRQDRWRHLALCALFFLCGFSVYMYLPIRSLTEPTFDWGNPETLRGFIFHITDRKDSQTHFEILNQVAASSPVVAETRESAWIWISSLYTEIRYIGWLFMSDINHNLGWVSGIGFWAGAVICFLKSRPFFLFCATVVGTNIAFFIHWRGEAFLPSYIIVSLFTSLFLYQIIFTRWWKPLINRPSDEPLEKFILYKAGPLGIRWGVVILFIITMAIPWMMIDRNYSKVDRSWNYLSDTLTRRVYLTLPDRAVFVSGLSWFFYNYNQDVHRLRDDVTAVTVWDLLSPHRTGLLTSRRYPNLYLPDEEKQDFKSLEGISDYTQEFLDRNSAIAPVVLEQFSIMYDQTKFTSRWQPYRNVLLQYESSDAFLLENEFSHQRSWEEFKNLLESELSRPNSGRDIDWLDNPKAWLFSMREYFHYTGKYHMEREVLTMMGDFLGQKNNLQWAFWYLDSLIADRRLKQAESLLAQINDKSPKSFLAELGAGLLYRAQGQLPAALDSFQKAKRLNPRSFRVNLEIAKTLRDLKMDQSAQAAFINTKDYISNVRELMAFTQESGQKK
jgi:tetratricopeptide (TPR) repeat protein